MIGRRYARGAAALPLVLGGTGCLNDAPSGATPSGPAQLSVQTRVAAGAADGSATLAVRVAYARTDGTEQPVDVHPSRFSVTRGATAQLRFVARLARCRTDPAAERPAGGGCVVSVRVSLLDPQDGGVVSSQTRGGMAVQRTDQPMNVDGFALAAPALALGRGTSAFQAKENGPLPAPDTVAVTSATGAAIGTVRATVADAAAEQWLEARVEPGPDSAAARVVVQPRATTPRGAHAATVRLTSSRVSLAPVDLAVAYTVTVPGAFALESDSVALSGLANEASPPAKVVAVADSAGGRLDGLAAAVRYAAGQPAGWLSASFDQASTPARLTLAPSARGLAAGTYAATVELTSSTPGVAPRTLPVTLRVSTIQAVDCSASYQPPSYPPPRARRVTPAGNGINGGAGTFTHWYNLGSKAQRVVVTWDMYGIPDAIQVCFRGALVYSSGGPVSGAGRFELAYPGADPAADPTPLANSPYLRIEVRAEQPGTAWEAAVAGEYVPFAGGEVPALTAAPLRVSREAAPRRP